MQPEGPPGAPPPTPSAAPLPRELVYVYLAAPLVLEPIMNRDFFREPAGALAREVLGNYVPWVAIPFAVHAAYRFAMPGLVGRLRSLWGKLAVQTVACAAVAAAVGAAVRPLHQWVAGEVLPWPAYMQQGVGFMCLLIAPALLVQELRARAHAAERRALEGQKAALRAQLEALQSRTQPHFLFNALNTIASLIRDDPDLAEQTVERLAGVLRYALSGSRGGAVSFGEEVDMVEEYLGIQRARFGEGLSLSLDVGEGLRGVMVAPFLLQPLVENAVVHGMAGRGRGTLRVSAARRAGALEIRVDDDGPGPGASRHRGSGTGLNDLRRRLGLLYGDRGTLAVRANELGGFTVELSVPLPAEGAGAAAEGPAS